MSDFECHPKGTAARIAALEAEIAAISEAIGSSEYMDSPDSGAVTDEGAAKNGAVMDLIDAALTALEAFHSGDGHDVAMGLLSDALSAVDRIEDSSDE